MVTSHSLSNIDEEIKSVCWEWKEQKSYGMRKKYLPQETLDSIDFFLNEVLRVNEKQKIKNQNAQLQWKSLNLIQFSLLDQTFHIQQLIQKNTFKKFSTDHAPCNKTFQNLVLLYKSIYISNVKRNSQIQQMSFSIQRPSNLHVGFHYSNQSQNSVIIFLTYSVHIKYSKRFLLQCIYHLASLFSIFFQYHLHYSDLPVKCN